MIKESQMTEKALPVARIIKAVGGQYQLDDNAGFTGIATARGIFRRDGISPTPGDLVYYENSGDPDIPWHIVDILPRRNILIRPPLANLDRLLITISATEPAADFYLIDKLITICLVNNIDPILIVTKTDQQKDDCDNIVSCYIKAGCQIIFTSMFDQASHQSVRCLIPDHLVSFAGQSGVGKSTLLNQLFGDEKMETGGISSKIGRGRHTTRHVELFPYDNGYIADTPGFSTLDLAELGLTAETLEKGYPEIAAVASNCRFSGCRHMGDLGCAVDDSAIDPKRLERYRLFRHQLEQVKTYERPKREMPLRTPIRKGKRKK